MLFVLNRFAPLSHNSSYSHAEYISNLKVWTNLQFTLTPWYILNSTFSILLMHVQCKHLIPRMDLAPSGLGHWHLVFSPVQGFRRAPFYKIPILDTPLVKFTVLQNPSALMTFNTLQMWHEKRKLKTNLTEVKTFPPYWKSNRACMLKTKSIENA